MQEPVIQFEKFTWQYSAQKQPSLFDIDLTIYKGEKILICGPSGCGKSTLGSCLNGLIPFSLNGEISGSLKLFGKESRELSIAAISKMVGTVLQDSDGQFVGLTVAEDLAFAPENDNDPQEELFRKVEETAAELGITDLLDHSPIQLSGGQKQRVSLGGVLVDHVPVLLFDEPLANLDPATGKHSIELIDELHEKSGVTEIIIEHRIEDVLHRHVDRVVLMNDGRITAVLPPHELLSTDLLIRNGIREPLYVTALKYAGIPVTAGMMPAYIETLRLTDAQKSKVLAWAGAPVSKNPAACGQTLLDVRDLEFSYKPEQPVLKGISFRLQKGQMLAIVGKNGAGKSTFAKALCGFVTPQKGSLTLEGTDLSSLSIKERSDYIGYVMQNPNQMISRPMIRDEVAMGLEKRGKEEKEIDEKVLKALEICGLKPFRKWPVSALSYGQKKRVTIASILVLEPMILLLDEPTAGQDWRHYTEIMEFLKTLNEAGITVVMITHDMHLMLEYCSRAIVFYDGQILADDTPARILTDEETTEKACLKLTSLYDLALLCGHEKPDDFVQHFIDVETRHRQLIKEAGSQEGKE